MCVIDWLSFALGAMTTLAVLGISLIVASIVVVLRRTKNNRGGF